MNPEVKFFIALFCLCEVGRVSLASVFGSLHTTTKEIVKNTVFRIYEERVPM